MLEANCAPTAVVILSIFVGAQNMREILVGFGQKFLEVCIQLRRASPARFVRQGALPPLAVACPEIFGAQTGVSMSMLLMDTAWLSLAWGVNPKPCGSYKLKVASSFGSRVGLCWACALLMRTPIIVIDHGKRKDLFPVIHERGLPILAVARAGEVEVEC
jgi:hypothetical protein